MALSPWICLATQKNVLYLVEGDDGKLMSELNFILMQNGLLVGTYTLVT